MDVLYVFLFLSHHFSKTLYPKNSFPFLSTLGTKIHIDIKIHKEGTRQPDHFQNNSKSVLSSRTHWHYTLNTLKVDSDSRWDSRTRLLSAGCTMFVREMCDSCASRPARSFREEFSRRKTRSWRRHRSPDTENLHWTSLLSTRNQRPKRMDARRSLYI